MARRRRSAVPPGRSPASNLALSPAPRAARTDNETFRLHSRRGSNRVLYLDFDGYTVAPGSWWQAAGYTALPFDSDGDPTTWGRSDHDAIQYIHQHVSEDYAPFDIDVTTEDPGAAAIVARRRPTGSTGDGW